MGEVESGFDKKIRHAIVLTRSKALPDSKGDANKREAGDREEDEEEMAEAVVNSVLERLGSLTVKDVPQLSQLDAEISSIKTTLETVGAYLRDAEKEADKSSAVHRWITEVRNAAYALDDIVAEVEVLHSRLLHRPWPGFAGRLRRIPSLLQEIAVRRKLATQIAEIRKRFELIQKGIGLFNLRTDHGTSAYVTVIPRRDHGTSADATVIPRSTSPLVVEEGVVGAERAKRHLLDWLVDKESRLITVSVVGMGGLGKTTLAKQIYNSQEVKNHFQCQAWITVAQHFNIQRMLRGLFKQFHQPSEAPAGDRSTPWLAEALRHCLKRKRYLIVLDDVWSINVWESVRNALPDDPIGSRVLITTRSRDVAISTYGSIYELQPLSYEESWELFLKKAFPPSGDCPPDLEATSQGIVKRCGGLPMAIAIVGALLSNKNIEEWKKLEEWKQLEESLSSQMESNPYLKTLERALKLSYNDLPDNLLPCFVYLSLFPNDVPIRCSRLARLWAAEGLIQAPNQYSVEEAAEDCVCALVQRNLVQASEFHDDGRVKSFQVHDLIHGMIDLVAKEQEFAAAAPSVEDLRSFADVRRVSINNNSLDDVSLDMELSHLRRLRSLFISGQYLSLESYLQLVNPTFRLLRVLDLEGANLKSFPTGIENLLFLRYLSLRNTDITALPKSVGKLKNVNTLDLKGTQLTSLPAEIAKLETLCHLLVGRRDKTGLLISPGIGNLTSLQTLKCIDITGQKAPSGELEKLTKMRSFCVRNLQREDGGNLCSSIQHMSSLVSFKAISKGGNEILDFHALSSPPPSLRRLHLSGRMENLPAWISSAHSLVMIRLEGSQLSEDPFKALKSLRQLAVLSLVEAYSGEELCCGDQGGFPELEVLNLVGLGRLKSFEVTKGAMPLLRKLQFDNCKGLWVFPIGIMHLPRLQQLDIINAPKELIDNIESHGHKDDIVRKIASISTRETQPQS